MVIPTPRPEPIPVPLREVVSHAPAGLTVTGIAMDSRQVRPGDVYLAVPGALVHGATFAADVHAAGAVAIITDQAGADLIAATDPSVDVPVVVVAEPRVRAGEYADVIYRSPSTDLTVIGVTGTNGKTTMSFLLESVFAQAGQVTGVMGTTGHHVAGRRLPSERTTPEAVEVHALLAHMRDAGVQTVVMEVSSHAMAFGRVNGVRFDAAIFTNLTQDHLDFHQTMANYFEAKACLFEMATNRIVCVDDEWGRRLVARWPDAVTYSVLDPSTRPGSPVDWQVTDLTPDQDGGSTFQLRRADGSTLTGTVGLPGIFNVANATGAIATAVTLGVAADVAVAGVEGCDGVPGRMQRVPNDRGIRAYVDYAHTPDAVARAIEATPGRVIVVVGCGGDRDTDKRPKMGHAAARLAQVVYVTDDNPRSEDPAAIRAAVMAGAMSVPADERGQVVEVADRREAIASAVAEAKPGDAVLLLGKGHEQGQRIGDITYPFDDVDELAAAFARGER